MYVFLDEASGLGPPVILFAWVANWFLTRNRDRLQRGFVIHLRLVAVEVVLAMLFMLIASGVRSWAVYCNFGLLLPMIHSAGFLFFNLSRVVFPGEGLNIHRGEGPARKHNL